MIFSPILFKISDFYLSMHEYRFHAFIIAYMMASPQLPDAIMKSIAYAQRFSPGALNGERMPVEAMI